MRHYLQHSCVRFVLPAKVKAKQLLVVQLPFILQVDMQFPSWWTALCQKTQKITFIWSFFLSKAGEVSAKWNVTRGNQRETVDKLGKFCRMPGTWETRPDPRVSDILLSASSPTSISSLQWQIGSKGHRETHTKNPIIKEEIRGCSASTATFLCSFIKIIVQ